MEGSSSSGARISSEGGAQSREGIALEVGAGWSVEHRRAWSRGLAGDTWVGRLLRHPALTLERVHIGSSQTGWGESQVVLGRVGTHCGIDVVSPKGSGGGGGCLVPRVAVFRDDGTFNGCCPWKGGK